MVWLRSPFRRVPRYAVTALTCCDVRIFAWFPSPNPSLRSDYLWAGLNLDIVGQRRKSLDQNKIPFVNNGLLEPTI